MAPAAVKKSRWRNLDSWTKKRERFSTTRACWIVTKLVSLLINREQMSWMPKSMKCADWTKMKNKRYPCWASGRMFCAPECWAAWLFVLLNAFILTHIQTISSQPGNLSDVLPCLSGNLLLYWKDRLLFHFYLSSATNDFDRWQVVCSSILF